MIPQINKTHQCSQAPQTSLQDHPFHNSPAPRVDTLLEKLNLAVQWLPCDVTTPWNLTFDMLSKALQHCSAIKTFTTECKNGLRDLELTDAEWTIGEQLAKVLKVSNCTVWGPTKPNTDVALSLCRFSKTRLCTSHVPHQTLPLSSWQWTGSTDVSPPSCPTRPMARRFDTQLD